MQEKYGFVYIWYDRKHKRFYIGCHWGTEDDGYICSSSWMNSSYKKRPTDFRRRILERVYTNKKNLLEREYHWLQMIKPEELRKRYYNLHNHHFGHWSTDEYKREVVAKKQRNNKLGKPIHSQEYKDRLSIENRGANNYFYGKRPPVTTGMLGKHHTDEYKLKQSIAMKTLMAEKGDWVSKESRQKVGQINSIKMKTLWQDPEYYKHQRESHKGQVPANKGKSKTPSQLNAMSETSKRLWQDPEYRKRQSEAHKKH